MRVYYDRDADVNLVKGKKVLVVGYGSQGHAHAMNLRDSGVKDVRIALKPGSATIKKAEGAGFTVMSPADGAKWADIIMVLAPDELQSDIYNNDLAANMGLLGQPSAPQVREAARRVIAPVLAAGKAAGILENNVEQAKVWFDDGFSFIGVGNDTGLLAAGVNALIASYR